MMIRNMVYIVCDSNDPKLIEEMMGDPELAKIMEEAGVISEPNVVTIS